MQILLQAGVPDVEADVEERDDAAHALQEIHPVPPVPIAPDVRLAVGGDVEPVDRMVQDRQVNDHDFQHRDKGQIAEHLDDGVVCPAPRRA